MQGFFWIAAIISLTVYGYSRYRRARTGSARFAPAELAMIVLILGTHSNAVRTSAEEVLAEPVVAATIIRGLMAGLAIMLVVPELLRPGRRRDLRDKRALLAMTFYGVVAVASIAYSSAQAPTAGKALELVAALLVAWSFFTGPDPVSSAKEAIKILLIIEGVLLAVAVVGFFAAPSSFARLDRRPGFVMERTMVAPYASSNGLSAAGGLLAGYSLAAVLSHQTRRLPLGWIAALAVSTVAVILASGRQGVVIWVASVGFALWLHRRRQLILFVAPAAMLLIAMNWVELLEILRRDQAPVNVATLSGRVTFWRAAVEAWLVHPWTGYGFGAGGRFVALASIQSDSISSVHGGFFEALVGVGLIGLIPLLYAVGVVCRWVLRNLRQPLFSREVVLIVPLLLHTTISNGIGAWLNSDLFIFLLLAGLATSRRRSDVPAESVAMSVGGPGHS